METKNIYKAVVPNNPRRNNNFLLEPIHGTPSLYKPANPMRVATEQRKNTSSIAGRCANFFTITFINANQNVESNMCFTPEEKKVGEVTVVFKIRGAIINEIV
jgi:hypothetical protein